MHNFAEQLQEQFNGRFRLRWSDKKQEYHLEQKVATGQVMAPPPIDPDSNWFDTYDDAWIRARDGYFYVMTIRHGDRMPCPVCNADVKVPMMETRESHCPRCQMAGRDGRYFAAYYPLNHILLEHLRDIDPLNGGPMRVRQRMRAKQLAKYAREQKEAIDLAEVATTFNKTQVENNPMTGYGDKTAQNGNPYDRLKGAGV